MSAIIETAPVLIPTGMALFDRGYHSRCFTDGQIVVKIVPGGRSEETAQKKRNQLEGEYTLLKKYLGKSALDSSFSVDDTAGWAVRIEQQFVSGIPLRESLGRPNSAVVDFFEKCLKMYSETGLTPDLLPDIMFDPSLGMYLTGRYIYQANPNVFLTPEEPVLVDTTLGKTFGNELTRPILTALVVRKIQGELDLPWYSLGEPNPNILAVDGAGIEPATFAV